jgi:hypothetical protein
MSFTRKYIIFLCIIIIYGCVIKQSIDFSDFSPENDLAYNNGYSLFPNPLESDKGWGGATFKWHLVDGIRAKVNYWNMGLAYTGGLLEYIDTCGWRQATINFGIPTTFNRVVIWLNTNNTDLLPDSFNILSWSENTKDWLAIKRVKNKRKQMEPYFPLLQEACQEKKIALVVPYEEILPTTKSSRIRFQFNNCGIDHGWINEFEVYYDSIKSQNQNLIIKF